MHAPTTFFGAVAAYASVATAYPYYPRNVNGTEAWGSWTVTSPSSNYPPSGSHKSLDFLVKYESQLSTTHCSAYFPGTAVGVGPEQAYTPCDDEAVSFTTDWNIGTLWLSQKLYQRGAIVELKGSVPLHLYGGNCTTNAVGGGTCYGPPFTVPVISATTKLASNGTEVGSNRPTPDDGGSNGEESAEDNSTEDESNNGQEDSIDQSSDNAPDEPDTSSDGDTAGDSVQDESTTSEEDTTGDSVQEESTTSDEDEPHESGSHYGYGGHHGNNTSFRNGTDHRGHRWGWGA
ncbi:hypothetical protein B0J12DRAFT_775863 [Macrophomina phaseolina]|uniref:Uncharacterized protein n=1 Tax=Macrophomina phaseolina TaxID=35725 RepID=A0ABQ8GGE4_9PEZI|nr:hypothetical protein B0J12DRAFT_775863 [Macrophomina phaseolina]